jgi:hypothetical protein
MTINNKLTLLACLSTFGLAANLSAQGGPPFYGAPAFFPTPAAPIPAPPAGTPPEIIVTGDVNNDGAEDVVHLNVVPAPDVVFAQLRVGAGYVVAPPTVLAGFPPITEMAIGDLNTDGNLDLALLSPGASTVFILSGLGTGAFVPGPPIPVPAGGGMLMRLAISEVTGDAIPDILSLVDGPGGVGGVDTVQVMVGVGGFGFVPVPASVIGPGTTAFEVVDIDNNGLQDIVTLSTAPANAFLIHGQVAPGMFVPGPMPLVPIPGGAPDRDIRSGGPGRRWQRRPRHAAARGGDDVYIHAGGPGPFWPAGAVADALRPN